MAGSNSLKSMKLPRLRTKDELLKTSPELFNKLLLGDDMSTARSLAPAQHPPGKLGRSVQSAGSSSSGGGSRQQQLLRTGSPLRGASRGGGGGRMSANFDTPRGFGDEPLSVEQELAIELESVKRERHQLMESIAQVKAAAGTAGGEAQQADIRQLLKELELKKAKLNELKGDSRSAEAAIAKIRDDDTDAQRLTPDACAAETSYIQCLADEMACVEDDLQEAEAKNRLYQLLGERTRREHMAIGQKVRDKQESLRACKDDLAALVEHLNATRAAREAAQREAAKAKHQVEEARADWTRKIRERCTEVAEMQRHQRDEHVAQVKRREKAQEKERAERAAQAKLKMEEEAYQLQVAALAPKIDAMEASWNRLRAISGAETPEQVVDYWKGLKAKQARMQALVDLAVQREAACKAEISQLLASRSSMYEATPPSSFCGGGGAGGAAAREAAADAAEAAAEAAEAEAVAAAAAQQQPWDDSEEAQAAAEAAAARIADAERRMAVAQAQFNKLRSVCVTADQGMRALAHRLSLALEMHAASQLGASAAAAAATAAAAAEAAASAQPAAVRQTRSSGSSSDVPARSGAGGRGGGHHRAGSRDHAAGDGLAAGGSSNPLASKAQRHGGGAGVSAAAAGGARARRANLECSGSGASFSGGGGSLALVREDSAGSGRRQQPPRRDLAGASGSAAGANTSDAGPPSRGRNTIDDESFFDGLPQLLADVTHKLERLMMVGQPPGLDAIEAAAAAMGAASLHGSASGGSLSAASTARQRSTDGGGNTTADADAGAAGAGDGPADAAGNGSNASDAVCASESAVSAGAQPASDEASAAPAVQEASSHSSIEAAATTAAGHRASTAAPAGGSSSGAAAATISSASGGGSSGPAASLQPAATFGCSPETSSIMPTEKALLKGMHRRTWVGAPWLDVASGAPLDARLAPSMKRQKGRKKEAEKGPDLSRIVGYIPPSDVAAESESDGDAEGDGAEGTVLDREWLKMRAAKLTARHNAKTAAAAAAQGGER